MSQTRSATNRLHPSTRRAIHRALVRVEQRCDRRARRHLDPIGLVRQYREPADLELAALIGASLAFGNVTTLRAKLSDAFSRLGRPLAQRADDELDVFTRLGGWRHRVYRGEDLARLVIGARRVQRISGSLGAKFHHHFTEHQGPERLRAALTDWVEAIRKAGGLDIASQRRRGAAHLLPDPRKASGCKRLLLFLRWMVRPDDGIDLGLWSNIPTAELIMPVDTHIFKLSTNLGFTKRKSVTWETAVEITEALRSIDSQDPVRFDFALCHLGMARNCPSQRDRSRCHGCGIRNVCRHWRGKR